MSTKVYGGRRFLLSRLNEFMRYAYDETIRVAVDHFTDIAFLLDDAFVIEKSHVFKFVGPGAMNAAMWNAFMEDGKSPDRSIFNMDCGWVMWIRGRYVYTYPWGPYWSEIELPDWVEDYAYWNNTDPDPSVSLAAWRRRERLWETILDEEQTRLDFHIFTNQGINFNRGSVDLQCRINDRIREEWNTLQRIYQRALKDDQKLTY